MVSFMCPLGHTIVPSDSTNDLGEAVKVLWTVLIYNQLTKHRRSSVMWGGGPHPTR